MYLPPSFKVEDSERTWRLIEQNPFATLVAGTTITHLPLLSPVAQATKKLSGHLARQNPFVSATPDWAEVTAIFHGPDAYISPRWYEEPSVPTWNYAVAHVRGRVRWVRELKPLIAVLKEMAERYEPHDGTAWRFVLPEDLRREEDVLGAIVGLEIEIEGIESKFKLSQNRSDEDRARVREALGRERTEAKSLEIAALMEESERFR